MEFGSKGIENGAKGGFTVGIADGMMDGIAVGETANSRHRIVVKEWNVAIVSKAPRNAPHFSRKGMDIGEIDLTGSGVANVSNEIVGLHALVGDESS